MPPGASKHMLKAVLVTAPEAGLGVGTRPSVGVRHKEGLLVDFGKILAPEEIRMEGVEYLRTPAVSTAVFCHCGSERCPCRGGTAKGDRCEEESGLK